MKDVYLMMADNKKKQSKNLPAAVRNAVWDAYIGRNLANGKCHACKQEIHRSQYEAGHIIARANGGDDNIRNLRPICSGCNKSIGTKNMDQFIKEYGFDNLPNNINDEMNLTEVLKNLLSNPNEDDPKDVIALLWVSVNPPIYEILTQVYYNMYKEYMIQGRRPYVNTQSFTQIVMYFGYRKDRRGYRHVWSKDQYPPTTAQNKG